MKIAELLLEISIDDQFIMLPDGFYMEKADDSKSMIVFPTWRIKRLMDDKTQAVVNISSSLTDKKIWRISFLDPKVLVTPRQHPVAKNDSMNILKLKWWVANQLKDAGLLEKSLDEERPTWKDSDAPDANGKFRDLGINDLADWLIRTRKGDMQRITGSLNQQIVFNRKKNPAYAKKMESVRAAVKRKLKKD